MSVKQHYSNTIKLEIIHVTTIVKSPQYIKFEMAPGHEKLGLSVFTKYNSRKIRLKM